MTVSTCPHCAAQISDQAATCPNCGKPIPSPRRLEPAPIHRLSGKLQATGVVLVASGIIATVAGAWWGPAVILPGIMVFIFGKF